MQSKQPWELRPLNVGTLHRQDNLQIATGLQAVTTAPWCDTVGCQLQLPINREAASSHIPVLRSLTIVHYAVCHIPHD